MNELTGTKITDAGINGEFPYLEFTGNGNTYRGYVQRDPEGNGSGFMFGLAKPDSDKIQDLQRRMMAGEKVREELNKVWTEEYYRSAIGVEITGCGETPGDYGDFPYLSGILKLPGEQLDIQLEFSCDEEGNRGGFLAIDRM